MGKTANKKRKPQNKINKEEINLLEPLNLANFTLENDPCFGKLHDLKAPECLRCGDAEICSIICSQNLKVERIEISNKIPLKEFNDEPDMKRVKKFMRTKMRKSISQEHLISLVQEKWHIKTKTIMKLMIKLSK